MMPSSSQYAVYLAITLLIEGALLTWLLGRRDGWRFALALNLLTHPLATFAHALLLPLGPELLLSLEPHVGHRALEWIDLLSLELCVVAVEGLLLWWAAGLRPLRALGVAALINLASASAEPLLRLLYGLLRGLL